MSTNSTFFLWMKHGLMRISQTMNYTLMAIILLEETEILSETAWQHILMSIYSLTTKTWTLALISKLFGLNLNRTKSKKILFGSLYRPPNFVASVSWQEVESILVTYSKDKNKTISLGDFNFDFALPLSGYQQKGKNSLHITRAGPSTWRKLVIQTNVTSFFESEYQNRLVQNAHEFIFKKTVHSLKHILFMCFYYRLHNA